MYTYLLLMQGLCPSWGQAALCDLRHNSVSPLPSHARPESPLFTEINRTSYRVCCCHLQECSVCHLIYRFETHLKPVNMLIALHSQFVSSDDYYAYDELAVLTIAVTRSGINSLKSTSFHIPQYVSIHCHYVGCKDLIQCDAV
jgi:hypothetical protein